MLWDGSMSSGNITVDGIGNWLVVGAWAVVSWTDSATKEIIVPCSVTADRVYGSSGSTAGSDMRLVSVSLKRSGDSLSYDGVMMTEFKASGGVAMHPRRRVNGLVGLVRA